MESGIDADRDLPTRRPHLPDDNYHTHHRHAYEPPPLPVFEATSPQLPPKLPFLTTANLHAVTSNGYGGGLIEGGDPAEFYREYRGVQQSSNGYTDITTNGMAAIASESRPAPSSLRSNGNGSTPKHPSVHSRNIKPSYRSASSPLDDRMTLPKSSAALNGYSKAQQPSVKDLLKRFDQNNEQSSSAARKIPTRGASKEGTTSYTRDRPGYMARTAASNSNTSNASRAHGRDNAGSKPRSPDKPRATQRTRFAAEDQHSNNTQSSVPRTTRPRNSLSSHNSQASRSMTNLSPTSPTTNNSPQTITRRPLFGEVLPIGQGSNSIGYGIPQSHSATRRTSDTNLHPNFSVHRRSQSELDISPSSPTAWYLGVTPALDDVDPNKSARAPPGHNRNHSDFADTKVNTMNGVSPSFEAPQPTSPQTSQTRNNSRLPVSMKRLSNSSESSSQVSTRANSPFTTKTVSSSKVRKIEQPWSPGRAGTPPTRAITPTQKSPRTRGKKVETASNGSLKAYISSPPTKSSPPLRSSRPRQPVSSAATTSSRQKLADRSLSPQQMRAGMKMTRNGGFEDPQIRKIPDLQKVDFAERRAKIQRAYTKSIHIHEQEAIRAANMRRLSERYNSTPLTEQGKDAAETRPETPPATIIESQPEPEPSPKPLQINTSFARPVPVVRGGNFAMDQDSPTLGMPGTFIDDDEPASAITDIDNEPQTEHARLNRLPSVKQLEPSRLSSQVMFTADELSPEQALFGFNQEQESIDIMLAPTPVDERLEASSRANDQSQNILATGVFNHEEHPTITSTLMTESPEGDSPLLPESITPFEPVDNRSMNKNDTETTVLPTEQSNLDSSENFYAPSSYAVSPETPDGPHLDIPNLRTALAPPSVSISDVEHDYLNTPVTDMEDEGSETGPVNHVEQGTFDSYDSNQEALPTSLQSYRTSHQSSWTDYSLDSALEQSGQEDYSLSASVILPSEPEKHRFSTTERAASPTPPVPPKPEGYSPLPSPNVGANPERIPSPSNHQLPPLSTGDGFSLGFTDHSRLSATTTPIWPDYSPPLPPVPQKSIEAALVPPTRTPPLPTPMNDRPQSGAYDSSHNERYSESRRPSDDVYSDQPSVSTPRSSTKLSFDDVIALSRAAPQAPVLDQTPEEKEAAEKEKKRLHTRKMIIKELIDTESIYLKDMNVVEEIYKGTAEACPKLDSGDIKVIFRNTDDIIVFSTKLLDDLKLAASAIYSPRTQKSRQSRATNSPSSDDRFSVAGTLSDDKLTDEQKDLKTNVGKLFGKHLKEMQAVYSEYLKSSEVAQARLSTLQQDSSVKVWLNECDSVAKDLTQAWDLDALLVKPVQRITRYQLLFRELTDNTPTHHPDHTALSLTYRSLLEMLTYIDELKKRIQMVGKIVSTRKRKDSDVRTGLAKAFGLSRVERLQGAKSQEDEAYLKLHEKFGDDYLRLQVVLRDVEFYTRQVTTYVNDFLRYLSAMELVMRLSPSNNPEIESKWARFNMSMRDMGTVALDNHIASVRLRVIEPFEKVIQAYGPPGLAMKKRAKRRLDYERCVIGKGQNGKLNEKDAQRVEQYQALNETLKIELPQLSKMTEKLGHICLTSFVMIQSEWYEIWQKKVKTVLEENQIPKSINDIVTMFSRDYKFVEGRAQELGIVNGNFTGFLEKTTSSSGKSSDGEKKGRPSNLSTRSRGLSVNSERTPSLPTPDFAKRLSGQFVMSPIGLTPTIPQFAYQAQSYSGTHSRAGSGSPATPDGMSRQSGTTLARPSTSRSYTSDNGMQNGFQRASNDYNTTHRRESGSTYNSTSHHIDGPPVSTRPYSGIFHSAMPLPDGPEDSQRSSRASSRDRNISGGYNVLYLAASLFEFNISATKSEAGYPYLTYQAGEIFDVIGEKGELWLAKNQDDPSDQVGWIWSKHFARLATD
ncbi:hypothetical protein BGZ60DRAFT_472194 [Tricladium varicosporioides]|nr:hypothetical protein BGZ60DRAFT_472194 [Hymenoscyphus varicosporioides]